MTNDNNVSLDRTDRGMQTMQREELTRETAPHAAAQMLQQAAEGIPCPFCGTINEPEAMFCASCGKPLRMGICPNCGSEIDPEADFCEICHHYIKSDVCSFCGAFMGGGESFCPQCGNPRGGLVCPTCNTLNDFSFCKQCGTPLTDEARQLVAQMKMQPEYMEMVKLAREYEELNMQLPYTSERDVVRDQMNAKLRERVLTLLAKDKGVPNPIIGQKPSKRKSKEELQKEKDAKLERLSQLLDGMALPAQPSPAQARNYAMAQKPLGVRLAWRCNFKNAMHSSPCGCAKPQLGGQWVILGKGSKQEIKDDK